MAVKYGGGGHLRASGVTVPTMDQNIIDDMVQELEKAVREYREERKNVGKRIRSRD